MPKKKSAPTPPALAAETRVTVINLKGSPELKAWLDRISEDTLIPAAAITRAALGLWAEKNGHPRPPRN